MKKCVLLLVGAMVMTLVLGGCGCEHTWVEADCEKPKTCSACGETEGAPLGHTWQAAACLTAKTCEICKKTEGTAAGHQWEDATCETPKTCKICKEAEGEALGHTWLDATTEAPKTCELCQKTEGERIITDERFSTEACKELFGKWKGELVIDGAEELDIVIEGENLEYITYMEFDFKKDGNLVMTISFEEESYFRLLRLYTIELMYATYAEMGLNREAADAAMAAEFGMDTITYVNEAIDAMDIDDYTQEIDMVYYVEGGKFFSAMDWSYDMTGESFTIDGDKITLVSDGQTVELIKQP